MFGGFETASKLTSKGWYPPTSFVRDIHPFFVLGYGCHDDAIDIDERLVKERVILLLPIIDPGFANSMYQGIDGGLMESTAIVAPSLTLIRCRLFLGKIRERETLRNGHDD